ncbi:MAG TPA: flagellar basal-body rod protein FlgF [Rhizomicrobium sp.]|nr:flagellar basal-body rod protein FlgF [Rhizomicrobium sp.]
MDNSLLVSLSHQLASHRAMDVIANNIANASTPGFKREAAKFEEFVTMMQPAEGQVGPQSVSFVKDAGIMRDSSQGNVQQTGATYDIAIAGAGYFAIQTPQGLRYTRDGHFSLDGNGNLVTSQGHQVQGDGGAILITPTDGEISIAPDGTISSVVNGVGNQLGKLKIVDFADSAAMIKQGGNLYVTEQAPTAPALVNLRQGALEASNVQPVIEISHMIEVMRAYEATAALSKSQEDMMRQAIEKLGQMPV